MGWWENMDETHFGHFFISSRVFWVTFLILCYEIFTHFISTSLTFTRKIPGKLLIFDKFLYIFWLSFCSLQLIWRGWEKLNDKYPYVREGTGKWLKYPSLFFNSSLFPNNSNNSYKYSNNLCNFALVMQNHALFPAIGCC